MFKREIETQIEIDAAPRIVWETLVGLEYYPEWNPMIRSARGRIEVGERLSLYYSPPGEKPRIFEPKLKVVEREKEFRWLGNPGVPFFFESEHYFLLEKITTKRALLKHNMLFYGILTPIFWGFIEKRLKGNFELMNEAHKKRAERLFQIENNPAT